MSSVASHERSCRICLSRLTCPTNTPCGHTFCYECITTHLATRSVCPICASYINIESLQSDNTSPRDRLPTTSSTIHNSNFSPQTHRAPPSNAFAAERDVISPSVALSPNDTRTPDITATLSSRRTAPPPLLRPPELTRSSPSALAARRIRAEAIAQVVVNPPPHLISADHLHPSIRPRPSHDHTHQPRPSSPENASPSVAGSASGSGSACADEPGHEAGLATALDISSGAASSSTGVPIPTALAKSLTTEVTSTEALFAATNDLTVEQLTGVIAHLKQQLQKKERSDRHIGNHLLLHFLRHAHRQKERLMRRIHAQLEILSKDIRVIETQCATQRLTGPQSTNPHIVPHDVSLDSGATEDPSLSRKRQRINENFDVLEAHYFNTVGRQAGEPHKRALNSFADDVFKLTQFSRFRDRASLMHVARVPDASVGDVFKASNIVSSMEFDRESEFLAIAGVTRQIKIFEFSNVTRNLSDVHYPIREIPTQAKLSWVCWNPYIRHHLLSSDYEGLVKIWDVNLSTALSEYEEHELRAWSVDYCPTKPAYFASGSDDGTVKIWISNQRNSVMTIDNKRANVCSVKFHPTAPEYLAFGSVDCGVHYYDLRNTRQPLQTFASHTRAVSYIKFMSNTELVSASVDSTIKLWDLKTMSLSRTFTGHANDKNFVGLSVTSDYIACGSEENMVYCYYKAVPPPLTVYQFSKVDPLTGEESPDDDKLQFVSSVCWCPNDPSTLVAANSLGAMKVLKLDTEDENGNEDSEHRKDERRLQDDEDDVR